MAIPYIEITVDGVTYRASSYSHEAGGVLYQGRLLNAAAILETFRATEGNTPQEITLQIRDDDGFLPSDPWAGTLTLTLGDFAWSGKVNAFEHDGKGVATITAADDTLAPLQYQIPDEVAHVFTVADVHSDFTDFVVPLVFGGTSINPVLVRGILIDKTNFVWAFCVGEIQDMLTVYKGREAVTTGTRFYYAGTPDQAIFPGFACVKFGADPRNEDGTWPDVYADIVGLKLGAATEEECRNPARILQYLLTTAKTGVNGWGLGIDSGDIDATTFNQAIADCATAGFKVDGGFFTKQRASYYVDQLCRAMRGTLTTDGGKWKLYVDQARSSIQTYDETNMVVLKYGRGAYSNHFNKVRLDYRSNPFTGGYLASETREDATSIAEIGEQEFTGQLPLVADQVTAGKIADYELRRRQYGLERIYFETNVLPSRARPGLVVTVNRPDLGITSRDYQIVQIEKREDDFTIEAQSYDAAIFGNAAVGPATGSPGVDIPVSPMNPPATASGLTLSTAVRAEGDGTVVAYVDGEFTLPYGKYLGAAVYWGIGAFPGSWTSLGMIQGNTFRLEPVKHGETYSFKVIMFNQAGQAPAITGNIVADTDTAALPTPTVASYQGLLCIKVDIVVASWDKRIDHFEIARRKSDGTGEATIDANFRKYAFVDDDTAILQNYTFQYQYRVRAVSRSGLTSEWSAWTTAVSAIQNNTKDITVGSITSDLITADQIIGKDIRTGADVGETVDGVAFSATGIEMWEDGQKKVSIPASGNPTFQGIIEALAGKIGGWNIFEDYIEAQNLKLNSTGSIHTSDFVSGMSGWRIDKHGDAEFNNARVRGAIKTAVFQKDQISVIGGYQMVRPAGIIKSSFFGWQVLFLEWMAANDILDSDETYDSSLNFATYQDFVSFESALFELTAGLLDYPAVPQFIASATEEFWNVFFGSEDGDTLEIDDGSQFALGDIIRIKDGLDDWWGEVADKSGNVLNVITKSGDPFLMGAGQSVVNYGPAGSGGIMLDGQSPLMDVYTHDGTPWTSLDIRVRIGNLNGWGSIDDDVFGIAIGNPVGQYLVYTPAGGLDIKGKITVQSGSNVAEGADVTGSNTAYDTARVAGTIASTVRDNASNALANAATANALLADIAADNKLTPVEKLKVKLEWDAIVSEKTKNDAQADAFSVSKVAYGSAYDDLNSYITPLLASLTTTSDITGSTFRATFKAYYDARTDLLNAVAAKAKSLADGAQTTANNAASAASSAQTSANTANSLLADIASDNKLTPTEKLAVKREWDGIVSEKTKNDAQADAFSVSKTAYGSAYTALSDYITPLLFSLTTTSDITGTTFRANFKGYYDARTDLLNAVAAKAKSLADGAQTTANNAASAASSAQTSANTANSLLADIAADNKLTPTEKLAVKREWDGIVSEKTKNDAQADAFSVSKVAYGNAYATLSDYITPLLSNLTTTSDITGSTFRANFKGYYDARTDLLNAVAAKAKQIADVGATHAGTAHAPSNADHTSTVIDGGLVTTGTLQVVQGGTVAAGVTGNTSGDDAIRFWAGATLANRATAPFRVTQGGKLFATDAVISGSVLVGVGAALNDDPGCNDPAAWYFNHQYGVITTTSIGIVGTGVAETYTDSGFRLLCTRIIPVDPAKTYRISCYARWVYPNESGGIFALTASFYSTGAEADTDSIDAESFQLTTTWTRFEHNLTIPTGKKFMRIGVMGDGYPWDTKRAYYQDIRVEEVLPSGLIKAGAVTAEKLESNLVTTNTLQVVQGGTVAAGMTGNTSGDTAVRFWAGETFANRATAPFRVTQAGKLAATDAEISGKVTASEGAIGYLTFTENGMERKVEDEYENMVQVFALKTTPGASESPELRFADITQADAIAYLSAYEFKLSTFVFGEIPIVRMQHSAALSQSDPRVWAQAGTGYYGFATDGRIYAADGFYPTSDRRVKTDIEDITVLEKIKQVEVKRYSIDHSKVDELAREKQIERSLREKNVFPILPIPDVEEFRAKHKVGIMADTFNAAFGCDNGNPETYDLTEAISVALRAVQELSEIVEAQKKAIEILQEEVKELRKGNTK